MRSHRVITYFWKKEEKDMNFFYRLLICTLMISGDQLYAIQFRVSNTDTSIHGFAKTVKVELLSEKGAKIVGQAEHQIDPGQTIIMNVANPGKYQLQIKVEGFYNSGFDTKNIFVQNNSVVALPDTKYISVQNNGVVALNAIELKSLYDRLDAYEKGMKKVRKPKQYDW